LVTIDAGTKDITTIGNNCFIMKHAHIGHDCMIGASAFIKGETKEYSKYAGVPAKYLSPNIKK
jgi:acyl-[acyl carrier protein]--UDP-N-acetylglucosamine O-acyltransferase